MSKKIIFSIIVAVLFAIRMDNLCNEFLDDSGIFAKHSTARHSVLTGRLKSHVEKLSFCVISDFNGTSQSVWFFFQDFHATPTLSFCLISDFNGTSQSAWFFSQDFHATPTHPHIRIFVHFNVLCPSFLTAFRLFAFIYFSFIFRIL